jgi:hypothetical protein
VNYRKIIRASQDAERRLHRAPAPPPAPRPRPTRDGDKPVQADRVLEALEAAGIGPGTRLTLRAISEAAACSTFVAYGVKRWAVERDLWKWS